MDNVRWDGIFIFLRGIFEQIPFFISVNVTEKETIKRESIYRQFRSYFFLFPLPFCPSIGDILEQYS